MCELCSKTGLQAQLGRRLPHPNPVFDVRVVGEACATFDRLGPDGSTYAAQLIHDIALSDLHGEFCQVVDIGELLTNVAKN